MNIALVGRRFRPGTNTAAPRMAASAAVAATASSPAGMTGSSVTSPIVLVSRAATTQNAPWARLMADATR